MKFMFLFLLFITNVSATPIDPLEFKSLEQEKRYFKLIEDLRCLKCQNSSLAGSNASLAQDLRIKVHHQMTVENMSDEEIKTWMVTRYGDFILYEPPFKPTTIILWALPLLLGVLGFVFLFFRLRRIKKSSSLSPESKNKLDEALKS